VGWCVCVRVSRGGSSVIQYTSEIIIVCMKKMGIGLNA
jgi:hypothetical protein